MCEPQHDYLERHLWTWAQWMRSGESVDGFPHASTGISTGGSSEAFEDMLEREERRIAAVTDTVIAGLPLDQRCAIHHEYLHAVYGLKDFAGALARAKDSVRVGLRARHVWLGEGLTTCGKGVNFAADGHRARPQETQSPLGNPGAFCICEGKA